MFVMERHRRLYSSNIVSLGVNINNDSNALLTHPLTIRRGRRRRNESLRYRGINMCSALLLFYRLGNII